MEASPAAHSVMQGQAQEFFVRFDRPVDHQASRLMIQQGDAVIRTPRPRLGASPNTLYARAGGAASRGGPDFTLR